MAGDVKVAVVSAQLASGAGGTADFTKAGFGTPKACIVIATVDTVDNITVAAQSRASIGFSDFTNDFCIAHQDENSSAKVDCDAIKSNTTCYINLDTAGSVDGDATASTITDGVRLTTGTAIGFTPFATVIMFGGADLSVSLVRTTIASAQNSTATIAHSGFTDGNDKLIFFIGIDVGSEDNSSTGINNSFGVCHATGSDAGGWTLTQRCLGWASDHNNTVGDPSAIVSTDRVLDILTEAGGQDWGLEVTNLDHAPAEWTVTTRDNGAGAGMEVYSLAMDLDDRKAKVGSVDSPVSGTSWTPSVSLGFTPQYVGLGLNNLRNEDARVTGTGLAGIQGISSNTGSGEETCHSWYNEFNAPTTNTNNLFRSRAIDLRTDDVVTVKQNHSHSSFNSGDWTYTINEETETQAAKWFYWAIEEVVTGAIVVGLATETDLAFALGRLKSLAVMLGAETDSAQGVIPSKSALLGTATETDSGFVVTHTKQRLLGIALETDAALALGRLKELLITLAAETDTTFVVVPTKARLLGIAPETDSALTLGRLKELVIALATETDSAFVIPPAKSALITLATETDSGFVVTHTKAKLIGTALETDSAFVITHAKVKTLGIALEVDAALVVVPMRLVPIALASELDTALALGRLKARLLGIALETDTALVISTSAEVVVGTALETDTALVLGLDKARLLGIANETDSALVVRPVRLVLITLANETDTALAIPHSKAVLLGIAAETDLALVVVPVGGVAPTVGGWLIPTYRRRRR